MAAKKKNGVKGAFGPGKIIGIQGAPQGAIPMILTCPNPDCCKRHIDRGVFAEKLHHTHACQFCGFVWRPAIQATIGVQFLPGFKDGDELLGGVRRARES